MTTREAATSLARGSVERQPACQKTICPRERHDGCMFHRALARSRVAAALMLLFSFLTACTTAPATMNDEVVLRFAVLGDAEPKPLPKFPGMSGAVDDVNALAARQQVDFVVGVGDIAHDGTLIQYEAATLVLRRLVPPFFPIMGNEEFNDTEKRFLNYANRWNRGKGAISSRRYVKDLGALVMIFASPDFGRDFNDDGIAWILAEIRKAAPRPVFLVVHSAQAGAYPENARKGIAHPGFSDVVAQPNVTAVISGDLHMDMDRVVHSKAIAGVHYLHIPALERTKIPDETTHTPMFRVFNLTASGTVSVDTYAVGDPKPLARHAYRFSIQQSN